MPTRSDQTQPSKAHPVSRAEFARRAGKGRSTITEACAGPLAAACLPGGRIDAAHAAAIAWARARGIDPAALLDSAAINASPPPPPPEGPKPAPPPGSPPLADPSQVTDLLDLTLRQVTDQHGSQQGLADWLDLRKTAAEIVRIEMANAEKAGTLISRQLIAAHVFGYIDGSQKRILSDAPKTIIARSFALAKSGGTIEDAEKFARDTLSSILRPARDQAARALRKPKKDQSDASSETT